MGTLPLWMAYALTVLLLLGIAGAVWLVPLARVVEDAPDGARWRDLRLWACVLVLLQIGIYFLFF